MPSGEGSGEPYEGKLHVRFDEGVLETELWNGLRHRRYGESCRSPKPPFLWPPRQRPTLQIRSVLDELPPGAAGPDLEPDARGLESPHGGGRQEAVGAVGPLSGTRSRVRRTELARGHVGNVHLTAVANSASLHKCLATTNIIESPQGGVPRRTDYVTRWRDADMVERWVASAWLLTEKHFRKILGYQDLWALAAILGRDTKAKMIFQKR